MSQLRPLVQPSGPVINILFVIRLGTMNILLLLLSMSVAQHLQLWMHQEEIAIQPAEVTAGFCHTLICCICSADGDAGACRASAIQTDGKVKHWPNRR